MKIFKYTAGVIGIIALLLGVCYIVYQYNWTITQENVNNQLNSLEYILDSNEVLDIDRNIYSTVPVMFWSSDSMTKLLTSFAVITKTNPSIISFTIYFLDTDNNKSMRAVRIVSDNQLIGKNLVFRSYGSIPSVLYGTNLLDSNSNNITASKRIFKDNEIALIEIEVDKSLVAINTAISIILMMLLIISTSILTVIVIVRGFINKKN